jgi:hypothetical protein
MIKVEMSKTKRIVLAVSVLAAGILMAEILQAYGIRF